MAFIVASAKPAHSVTDVGASDVADWVGSTEPLPDDAVLLHNQALALFALNRVQRPRRAVLMAHDLDLMSHSQTARALSISRLAVELRLQQARSALSYTLRTAHPGRKLNYRQIRFLQGLLPAVRAFVNYLVAELPRKVAFYRSCGVKQAPPIASDLHPIAFPLGQG
jgi:hypothetical protein